HTTELDPAVIGPLVDVQPVAILATRAVTTEHGAQQQALIHWSGLSPQEATWEDIGQLQLRYPNLEDKVVLEEHGNDTSQNKSSIEVGGTMPAREKRVTKGPAWLRDFVTSRNIRGRKKKDDKM
ncbi:hypothetical protein A2U01_0035385, partial [Trifolium medium]|nr:hypothetical protein [Trifolium medium]